MLDATQALTTFGQLGAAIPGFAGAVTVLRHRGSPDQPTELSPAERRGVLLVFSLGSLLAMGAVLPRVLASTIPEPMVWRICGIGLAGGLTAITFRKLLIAHRAKGTLEAPRRPRALKWTFAVPALLVASAQFVTLFWANSIIYLAGLTLVLVGAGVQFWLLVVRCP